MKEYRRTDAQNRSGEAGPRCLAVMYHYVHDCEPMMSHGVGGLSTADFNRQLDQLCSSMEPIDWPSVYAWLDGRGSIPERCFLLTFDDGLADHVKVVLPILQQRQLHGVFFVPGRVLTHGGMLPAHAIHLLLSTLGEEQLRGELLAYLRTHAPDTDWATTLEAEAAEVMYHYESKARAQLKYLLTMTLPLALRRAAVESLFTRHVGSLTRWGRSWYMGWDDVMELETLGHTIGAHGQSHEPYARLTASEFCEDIYRVAAVLKAGIGAGIRPFSYPYGSFDEEAMKTCRGVGFAHAFTTERNWITADCDVMRIPRVDTIDVGKVLQEKSTCLQA